MICLCNSGYFIQYKIVLLDQSELFNEILSTETGQEILNLVLRKLNIIEYEYFGLRFIDSKNQTHWLNPHKTLKRQLHGRPKNHCHVLYFGIKFYAPDPCKLIDETTRYQFFLQVKLDILHGRLPVTYDLAVELGSYIVQSELGDYDYNRHYPGYVADIQIISNQTVDFEIRVEECHKKLSGQLPSKSELNFLDKVKWLEMYGVDLHTVLGEDDVEYFIGLTSSGVIVIRNKTTIASYYWTRILKIFYKNRFFMLKISDKNNMQNTYGFEMPSKAACKHLWKCCREHQSFFKISPQSSRPNSKSNLYFYKTKPELRNEKSSLKKAQGGYQPILSSKYSMTMMTTTTATTAAATAAPPTTKKPNEKLVSGRAQRSSSPLSIYSVPWEYMRKNPYVQSPKSLRSMRGGRHIRSASFDSQSSNELNAHFKRKSKYLSDHELDSKLRKSQTINRHQQHQQHQQQQQQQQLLRNSNGNLRGGSAVNLAKTASQKPSEFYQSGLETESELSYRHQRNRRKRRRRHRRQHSAAASTAAAMAASDTQTVPVVAAAALSTSKIAEHFNYDLIDTSGMTESQLKEIPYTIVHTNQARQLKLKNNSAYYKSNETTTVNGKNDNFLSCSQLTNYDQTISNNSNCKSQNLNRLFDSLSVYDRNDSMTTPPQPTATTTVMNAAATTTLKRLPPNNIEKSTENKFNYNNGLGYPYPKYDNYNSVAIATPTNQLIRLH